MLRDLLVDEARAMLLRQGVRKPNVSQISTATGLNRKAITAWVRSPPEAGADLALSPAITVFTRWLQLATEDPARRRLAIKAPRELLSFESLAHDGSKGNVHHRSVLDDLVRLGMVSEIGDQVELTAEGFVPAADLKGMLAFLGENGRDHLQAAVNNTLRDGPRLLERAVFADGLTASECERVHNVAREQWASMHHVLVDELTKGVELSGPEGRRRIKIGVYVLHEDAVDRASAAPLPSPARD